MTRRAIFDIAIILTAGFSIFPVQRLLAQKPAANPAATAEVSGIAPRPSPAEYQTAVRMGQYTLAVDFDAHGVPTSDGVFSTEEFIVFEVALYGPSGSHLPLQYEDFSLRMNGKKQPAPSQPFTFVFKTLKSPEWEATLEPVKKESGNGINAGGGGGGGENLPPPKPKMPIDVERRMELRVQKAAVPGADRPLPVTGLIFFPYSGKTKNIKSMDLIYTGAAGKATIPMQP
jgi:hypothetical protein